MPRLEGSPRSWGEKLSARCHSRVPPSRSYMTMRLREARCDATPVILQTRGARKGPHPKPETSRNKFHETATIRSISGRNPGYNQQHQRRLDPAPASEALPPKPLRGSLPGSSRFFFACASQVPPSFARPRFLCSKADRPIPSFRQDPVLAPPQTATILDMLPLGPVLVGRLWNSQPPSPPELTAGAGPRGNPPPFQLHIASRHHRLDPAGSPPAVCILTRPLDAGPLQALSHSRYFS